MKLAKFLKIFESMILGASESEELVIKFEWPKHVIFAIFVHI